MLTKKKHYIFFKNKRSNVDVTVEALMLKKVDLDSCAIHLANRVLPVPILTILVMFKVVVFNEYLPGGPNSSNPFGGPLNPLNKSGRIIGQITISCIVSF